MMALWDASVEQRSAVRSGLNRWCDPREADAGSTHATNVVTQERHGQEVAIREATDAVAVVCRLGDLKSATPLLTEMTAHLDRRTGREVRSRFVI
jgi:hypothetical protein